MSAPTNSAHSDMNSCKVCDVKFFSRESFNKHSNTDEHKKKMRIFQFLNSEDKFVIGNQLATVQPQFDVWPEALVGLNDVYELYHPQTRSRFWICGVCFCGVLSLPSLYNHVQGVKHRKRFIELRYPDKKERITNKNEVTEWLNRVTNDVAAVEGKGILKHAMIVAEIPDVFKAVGLSIEQKSVAGTSEGEKTSSSDTADAPTPVRDAPSDTADVLEQNPEKATVSSAGITKEETPVAVSTDHSHQKGAANSSRPNATPANSKEDDARTTGEKASYHQAESVRELILADSKLALQCEICWELVITTDTEKTVAWDKHQASLSHKRNKEFNNKWRFDPKRFTNQAPSDNVARACEQASKSSCNLVVVGLQDTIETRMTSGGCNGSKVDVTCLLCSTKFTHWKFFSSHLLSKAHMTKYMNKYYPLEAATNFDSLSKTSYVEIARFLVERSPGSGAVRVYDPDSFEPDEKPGGAEKGISSVSANDKSTETQSKRVPAEVKPSVSVDEPGESVASEEKEIDHKNEADDSNGEKQFAETVASVKASKDDKKGDRKPREARFSTLDPNKTTSKTNEEAFGSAQPELANVTLYSASADATFDSIRKIAEMLPAVSDPPPNLPAGTLDRSLDNDDLSIIYVASGIDQRKTTQKLGAMTATAAEAGRSSDSGGLDNFGAGSGVVGGGKQGTDRSTIRCFRCDAYGHVYKNCPSRLPTTAGDQQYSGGESGTSESGVASKKNSTTSAGTMEKTSVSSATHNSQREDIKTAMDFITAGKSIKKLPDSPPNRQSGKLDSSVNNDEQSVKLLMGSSSETIPIRYHAFAQPILDQCKEPLVGVEEVCELCSWDITYEPGYLCKTCRFRCDANELIAHLTSSEHRLKYFEKTHLSLYRTLATGNMQKSVLQALAIKQHAQAIELREGRARLSQRLTLRVDPGRYGLKKRLVAAVENAPSPFATFSSPQSSFGGVPLGTLGSEIVRFPSSSRQTSLASSNDNLPPGVNAGDMSLSSMLSCAPPPYSVKAPLPPGISPKDNLQKSTTSKSLGEKAWSDQCDKFLARLSSGETQKKNVASGSKEPSKTDLIKKEDVKKKKDEPVKKMGVVRNKETSRAKTPSPKNLQKRTTSNSRERSSAGSSERRQRSRRSRSRSRRSRSRSRRSRSRSRRSRSRSRRSRSRTRSASRRRQKTKERSTRSRSRRRSLSPAASRSDSKSKPKSSQQLSKSPVKDTNKKKDNTVPKRRASSPAVEMKKPRAAEKPVKESPGKKSIKKSPERKLDKKRMELPDLLIKLTEQLVQTSSVPKAKPEPSKKVTPPPPDAKNASLETLLSKLREKSKTTSAPSTRDGGLAQLLTLFGKSMAKSAPAPPKAPTKPALSGDVELLVKLLAEEEERQRRQEEQKNVILALLSSKLGSSVAGNAPAAGGSGPVVIDYGHSSRASDAQSVVGSSTSDAGKRAMVSKFERQTSGDSSADDLVNEAMRNVLKAQGMASSVTSHGRSMTPISSNASGRAGRPMPPPMFPVDVSRPPPPPPPRVQPSMFVGGRPPAPATFPGPSQPPAAAIVNAAAAMLLTSLFNPSLARRN